MQIVKFGALTVLGAALALPAMAQVRDLDAWQQHSHYNTGYNTAFSNPTGLCCANGSGQSNYRTANGPPNNNGYSEYRSGISSTGPTGWSGSGYGPSSFNGRNGDWRNTGHSQNGNGNWNGIRFGQNGSGNGFNGPNSNSNGDRSSENGFNNGNQYRHSVVLDDMHTLRQDLRQAGYSNVQVVPEAFLVRAQDRRGREVMMLVSPDSLTTVTGVGAGSNSTSGEGSVAHSGNMQSGSKANEIGPKDLNDFTGNRE